MFFIFLFFLPFIHPDPCPIIKCMEVTNTFVCFYGKPFESTYIIYLGTCPKGYGCRRGLTSLIKECLPDTDYLLEGQSCSYNAECYSQICKDKKCVGLADNEKCDNHVECSNKSYCSMNNTCQPLKKKGEECDEKDRNPCDFGMMCGKDDPNGKSKCIVLGKIELGHYASDNMLCSTLKSYIKYCVEMDSLREGLECETGINCPIMVKYNNLSIPIISKCECGLNGKDIVCNFHCWKNIKSSCISKWKNTPLGHFQWL